MSLAQTVFKGCTSPAQYYRALILADRYLVPAELAEVWHGCQQVLTDAPPEIIPTLKKTYELLQMGGRAMRPYARKVLTENVILFEAPQPEGGSRPEGRGLLICFAGNAGRLMLPTSVLLQQLPVDGLDVAMLSDATGLGFLRGVSGFADDLQQALQRLLWEVGRERYGALYCLGTSGGGAAALYGALLAGADAGLSMGGHHPTVARDRGQRAERFSLTGNEFDELVRDFHSDAVRTPVLTAIFGELNERDRRGAVALTERLPGSSAVGIRGLDAHGVLLHLCTTRQLPGVLNRYLFSATR